MKNPLDGPCDSCGRRRDRNYLVNFGDGSELPFYVCEPCKDAALERPGVEVYEIGRHLATVTFDADGMPVWREVGDE